MYSYEEFEDLKKKDFFIGYSELLENIQFRVSKNLPVASYELDYYCLFLRLAKDQDGNRFTNDIFAIPECEDDNFRLAYEVLWDDLEGTKNHLDYRGDEFLRTDISNMLILLDKVYAEWFGLVTNERLSNQKLKIIGIETRKHLKALKKQANFKVDGEFFETEDYKQIKKKIILFSKYVYLKVVRLFEEIGAEEIKLRIAGEEVKINYLSLIHIIFGHYPGTTEGYIKNKSYFSEQIMPKDLITKIEEIFSKIGTAITSLEKDVVYSRYNGVKYAIWFKEISVQKKGRRGNSKEKVIYSFYPITEKYELDRIERDYIELQVDEKLELYKLRNSAEQSGERPCHR